MKRFNGSAAPLIQWKERSVRVKFVCTRMNTVFSVRFSRPVIVTNHARSRMAERDISEAMLLDIVDNGNTRYRDSTHLWVFKEIPERHDNLLCVVVVLENAVVVKTVLHHFSLL